MKPFVFSVIMPILFIISGIIMMLMYIEYGLYVAGIGGLWLIISFLIGYKEDEEQPLGMGRGRKR